ncbi:DUF6946 family protein [Priestia megaterium]|uniref:DUF6946 family protein n=1 Tax=Priestia megaterium TaxID=1404 RepID=UPI00300B9806
MKTPKVFGTFYKMNDKIMRTQTYLQWGVSKKSIGAVIMSNPGSSKLKSLEEWGFFLASKQDRIIGELSIDPTMQQLIRVVNGIYAREENLEGRLYIYNLFSLRNSDINISRKEFELIEDKILKENELIIEECFSLIHPWFLLAWGCNHPKQLKSCIEQWNQALIQHNAITFGKRGKTEWDYYHPSPPVQKDKDIYYEEIQRRYQSIFKQGKEITNQSKASKTFYIPSEGPEDWKGLLVNREKQFKTGFSAKTLAYCWENQSDFPQDIKSSFHTSDIPLFKDVELLLGLPEYKVSLPGGSTASRNDIFVLAKGILQQNKEELIAIAVEGKVNEDFARTVGKRLGREPSKGLRKRVQFLLETLGLEQLYETDIFELRYQLLHRAGASILLAKKFTAPNALMLIHSFSRDDKGFCDYDKFVSFFKLRAVKNRIIGPVTINGINLYFGWIKGNQKFLSC